METKTPKLNLEEISKQNAYAWSIARQSPAECFEVSEQTLNSSKEIHFEEGEAEALANMGAAKIWLSEYDYALNFCLQAKQKFEDLKQFSNVAKVDYNIGVIFFYLSDYNNALQSFMSSLKNYDIDDNQIGVADAYNGIGSVYYAIDENNKAIDYLSKCIEICREFNDVTILPKALDGIGQAYINLNQYENALKALIECIEVIEKTEGSLHVKSHCYNSLGTVHFLLGKPDESLNYYNKSLSLRIETDFKPGQAECLTNIGILYLETKEFSLAEQNLNDAIKMGESVKAKESVSKSLKNLSLLYEKTNQYDKALEHFKRYDALKEEIKNENTDRRTKGLELKFKMEQEQNEKVLLEKQNANLKKYSSDLLTLGEIGKSLMTLHSVEKIIENAYSKINDLMDAPSFGIGVYDDEKESIEFPGFIENGNKLPVVNFDINDSTSLAHKCFVYKQEIIIQDFETEYSKWFDDIYKPRAGKETHSIIYIPFNIPNGSSGVVTVQSFTKNAYKDHQVNMLRNLSVYMAIALENARLYQNLEQKVNDRTEEINLQKQDLEKAFQQTSFLSEVGQQLTSSTDFESIFLKLHQNVSHLMDAACFGVRLYKPEEQIIEYKFEIENGQIDNEVVKVSMSDVDNYSVLCVKNKQVIFINDNLNEYQKYTNNIIVPSGEMPHSLIFYPMTIGDRVIGVITVQSFKKFAYNEQHKDILKTLSSFTAIALENVNLLENLEDKVDQRTEEVVSQKEEIEKTYENTKLLSEIGKEISSELSTDAIISKVYKSLNTLMDATIFGIAIYREQQNDLYFSGAMEKGVKLSDFSYPADDVRIAAQCFRKEEEIIINNWEKEFVNYVENEYKVIEGAMPESMIYIPIESKGNIIGVMTVQSFVKDIYQDYHLNILRSLSVYIGNAIENANLYQSMEERVQQRTEEIKTAYLNTKLLSEISKSIAESLEVKSIVSNAYNKINNLMNASCFGIGLFDEDEKTISFPGYIEDDRPIDEFTISIEDKRLASWCVMNKKQVFIKNYAEEYKDYLSHSLPPLTGKDSVSIIYLPLFLKKKIIGVLTVQSFEQNTYTEYHLDILESLATTIASAVENAKLYASLEDKVKVRTAEVVKQKEIIEEKNKDITDSIRYAQRIQNVILPEIKTFNKIFEDSFVFFKPKDIVSGDFYWLEEVDNKVYFSVVDCTGHGVPGALVSLVGANGLNRCLVEFGLRKPSDILNQLNHIVMATFAKTDDDVKDGMDLAICCWDKKTNQLEYAGANNPLWIIRDNKLMEIKADKQPIGHFIIKKPFTNHTVNLLEGDQIYLFSDGYPDQFGGDNQSVRNKGGKKIKNSMFKKLLLEEANKPMNEQHETLENYFNNWKGSLKQIDDVCILGIKV